MAKTIYGTSPIKRQRRTTEQLDALREAISEILAGEKNKITIRHLFYRLVGKGVIPKDESSYKLLCAHLSKWRKQKRIPFSAFADNTRWYLKAPTFCGLDDALSQTVDNYRRNMWANQPYYMEVWTEKNAIAAIVYEVANQFGVPVFVARGFNSLSSFDSCAEVFRHAQRAGKDCVIVHLGDHDPSGVSIGQTVV